jgi:predicted Zn-dependent protease
VRSLLQDDRQARSILTELQLGPDIAVAYLASMFLGAIAERRNERDEAERCYRVALARFGGGQSAQLALGALLFGSGRSTEARELVARSMDREQNSRREPWWWYHFEPTDLVEANYEVLRREALR